MLRFRIVNEIVVGSEGRIACNIPGAVCEDCVELLLDKVADPPGLVCFEGLSAVLAREILQSFAFLLSRSEAFGFFAVLFPRLGTGKLS
jgi:hypothetical protein